MKTAIITGASSGLGKEFLYALAEKFSDIEEIWLIARRKDRLEELALELSDRKIVPVGLDLTDMESFSTLKALFEEKQPQIDVLINNAGFGTLGDFADATLESQGGMIDLNVRALTEMTLVALPYMQAGSFIVNTCSIASFAPSPRMAVYSSTKAYVLSFSKALREELKKRKINVVAVCPGPMATEFLDIAKITGNSKTFELLPYCDPKKVARKGLEAGKRGKAVYTPRAFYKLERVLAKLLPHSFVMKFTKT